MSGTSVDIVGPSVERRTGSKLSSDRRREHDAAVADLLDENHFQLVGADGGQYRLRIIVGHNRLLLDVRSEADQRIKRLKVDLVPFHRLISEYHLARDSYYAAIKTSTPDRIEAIDMGRRSLHNQGAELLREALGGTVFVDFDTARRLFTLISV